MFLQDPFEFTELQSTTSEDGKRAYTTPDGKQYESVTTFLGRVGDKAWLEEWRNTIGHELAELKSRYAKDRGTAMHKALEMFLSNEKIQDEIKDDPFAYDLYLKTKKALEQNITKIHNQEFCVYSHRLKLAGRVDLLAEWRSSTAVIDFKTSEKPKSEDQIYSYFLQVAIYCMCLYEIYGIVVKRMVVIVACESLPTAQIFEKTVDKYIPDIIRLVKENGG